MDQLKIRSKAAELFKKYRYGILIVLLGIALMCLPGGKKEAPVPNASSLPQDEAERSLEESLASILGQIKGAGKVQVLLTEAKGTETVYQSDDSTGNDTKRQDTVIISGADRGQTGLVRTVTPATFLGAIVVCQGADDAALRLELTRAVSNVTGLGTDRISIVKMK